MNRLRKSFRRTDSQVVNGKSKSQIPSSPSPAGEQKTHRSDAAGIKSQPSGDSIPDKCSSDAIADVPTGDSAPSEPRNRLNSKGAADGLKRLRQSLRGRSKSKDSFDEFTESGTPAAQVSDRQPLKPITSIDCMDNVPVECTDNVPAECSVANSMSSIVKDDDDVISSGVVSHRSNKSLCTKARHVSDSLDNDDDDMPVPDELTAPQAQAESEAHAEEVNGPLASSTGAVGEHPNAANVAPSSQDGDASIDYSAGAERENTPGASGEPGTGGECQDFATPPAKVSGGLRKRFQKSLRRKGAIESADDTSILEQQKRSQDPDSAPVAVPNSASKDSTEAVDKLPEHVLESPMKKGRLRKTFSSKERTAVHDSDTAVLNVRGSSSTLSIEAFDKLPERPPSSPRKKGLLRKAFSSKKNAVVGITPEKSSPNPSHHATSKEQDGGGGGSSSAKRLGGLRRSLSTRTRAKSKHGGGGALDDKQSYEELLNNKVFLKQQLKASETERDADVVEEIACDVVKSPSGHSKLQPSHIAQTLLSQQISSDISKELNQHQSSLLSPSKLSKRKSSETVSDISQGQSSDNVHNKLSQPQSDDIPPGKPSEQQSSDVAVAGTIAQGSAVATDLSTGTFSENVALKSVPASHPSNGSDKRGDSSGDKQGDANASKLGVSSHSNRQDSSGETTPQQRSCSSTFSSLTRPRLQSSSKSSKPNALADIRLRAVGRKLPSPQHKSSNDEQGSELQRNALFKTVGQQAVEISAVGDEVPKLQEQRRLSMAAQAKEDGDTAAAAKPEIIEPCMSSGPSSLDIEDAAGYSAVGAPLCASIQDDGITVNVINSDVVDDDGSIITSLSTDENAAEHNYATVLRSSTSSRKRSSVGVISADWSQPEDLREETPPLPPHTLCTDSQVIDIDNIVFANQELPPVDWSQVGAADDAMSASSIPAPITDIVNDALMSESAGLLETPSGSVSGESGPLCSPPSVPPMPPADSTSMSLSSSVTATPASVHQLRSLQQSGKDGMAFGDMLDFRPLLHDDFLGGLATVPLPCTPVVAARDISNLSSLGCRSVRDDVFDSSVDSLDDPNPELSLPMTCSNPNQVPAISQLPSSPFSVDRSPNSKSLPATMVAGGLAMSPESKKDILCGAPRVCEAPI